MTEHASIPPSSRVKIVYWLLGLFSVFLLLKNMWIAEDAFITLRSVEQYLNGNGFRWNPHDRTQVYTSPLWFLLIVLTTFFSKTLFLNLVGLSIAMHILLLWVMAKLIPDARRWVCAVLLLTLSQAFFEFTGSGLEYPLAYLLLATSLLLYARNRFMEDRYWIALSSGLALIARHDLLCLLLPMLCHLLVYYARTLTWSQLIRLGALFSAPLVLWSLFSLLYYGVPLPNTAYAKLSITGLPLADRLTRGLIYLTVSLKVDPVTPAILLAGTLNALLSRQIRFRMIGLGVLLAFLYVTSIGGDYMIGRFYAPLYLVAVLALALPPFHPAFTSKSAVCLLALASSWLLVLFVQTHLDQIQTILQLLSLPSINDPTPVIIVIAVVCLGMAGMAWLPRARFRHTVIAVFCSLLFHSTLQNDSPWLSGGPNWGKTTDFEIYVSIDTTTRERYWTYRWTSLLAWLNRDAAKVFPDHDWCKLGADAPPVAVIWTAGMQGYCMPLNHIAIEFNGLIDPLIARMPKHPNVPWVPGGIVRIVPEGYLESLVARRNLIKDPDLARYYDVLILITQSDTLFTIERLTTIIRFNLGAYEPLRQAYITRILQNPPKPPEGL
jgi:hypothetical protein